jgi:very-short-patch-repair endonuclease
MHKGNFENNLYQKKLRPFASKLRKEMTKSEACLWKYVLRAGLMKGYSFRRQRPVLQYIADFMCIDLKLIIEIDGVTHTWENSIERDLKRQGDLECAGFTVLRFTDEEVLKHMNIVRVQIEHCISKLEAQVHPLPPPAGDSASYFAP